MRAASQPGANPRETGSPPMSTEDSFVDGKRPREKLPIAKALLPVGARIECDFTDHLYVGTVIRHKNGAMVTRFDSDGDEVAVKPHRHSFREVLAGSSGKLQKAKRKSMVGSSTGSSNKRVNVGAPVAAAPALVRPHSEVKQGQKRTLEAKQEGQTAMAASTASGFVEVKQEQRGAAVSAASATSGFIDVKQENKAAAAAASSAVGFADATALSYDINSISEEQLQQALHPTAGAKFTIGTKIVAAVMKARPFTSITDARRRVQGLGQGKINYMLSRGIQFPGAASVGSKPPVKKRAVAKPALAASATASAPAHQAQLANWLQERNRSAISSSSWSQSSRACSHFVYQNPGPTIDMKTGLDAAPPEQWESKAAAERAANGTENIGRWIGDIKVSLSLAEEARLSELGAAMKPLSNRVPKPWNEDGMFYGKAGLVPSVRLEQWVNEGKLIPLAPEDMDAISNLAVLSSPNFRGALGNGGWKKAVPFIRSFCNCPKTAEPSTDPADKYGIIRLSFRVYVSRLFFELIADESYSELVKCMIPCAPFTPCAAAKTRSPKMFTTTINKRAADNAGYCFTLEGLLKSQEHEGYPCTEARPTGMKPDFPGLFPFQRSTVKWMIDAEQGPGINSYFWETRPWADGGAFFFFPLGGELRLLRPPEATGGLLSEEMGLGKTIEMLALTLLNPRPKSQLTIQYQRQVQKLCTRATLIIAPKALIGQWCAELQRYANNVSIVTFDTGDENVSKADSSCVRRTGGRACCGCAVGEKVETMAFGGSNRWVPATVVRVYRRRDSVLYDLRISITAEFLCDHDFVFTSYPTLKTATGNAVLYCLKKISWWRIALDECQMVREATTNLAKACTDLASVHRWMISGTPLTTSIQDLNGELQFLRVWPFSLSDKDDGFWEHRIGSAWDDQDPAALDLLDPLLSTVMIRHSKSQRQLDGSKLTSLPTNSIQWQGLPLGKGSAAYLYLFIESFVASEVTRRVQSGWGRGANGVGGELNADDKRCFHKLRGLMTMLQRACTDVKLVELPLLDDAIRKLERRVGEDFAGSVGRSGDGGLRKMNGRLILMWLRQVGRSEQETANVQTDRSYAVETEATQKARATYEAMSVAELRTLVKARNLIDRQEEAHKVCIERFRAISGGDVPQRHRVPLSELPGGAVGCRAGDTINAPWSDSVVLRPAHVTKVHKQSCCLEYMQSHSTRETVTKVEASRLSGNSSILEPGSKCMMQTVRYGVTAAFLQQSNTVDQASAAGGPAAAVEDTCVIGTPILYVEEPGSEPVAGVIIGITTTTSGLGEKAYDILLQDFVPVTIDKVIEKKGKDKGHCYNVVLDARAFHVGRPGDTIDKPIPIEDLRPRPSDWDSGSLAEPRCFVAKDADSGDTGVTSGTKVLFERVLSNGPKKVKAKNPELSEPYCYQMLRHSPDTNELVPVDVATVAKDDVVMMRETVDVDKKHLVGDLSSLGIGDSCQVNRGWRDHFKAVDAIICAFKYPLDPISGQPNKTKTPRYSCILTNQFKRFKIKEIHDANKDAAASAAEYKCEAERTFDMVPAPLHEATITETFEKSFDLKFGDWKTEARLPAQRLQLVQRVQISQIYLRDDDGGAPVPLRPPTLQPHIRAAMVSQRGSAAAAAAEAELAAEWSPFQELKPGMQVMVAPHPLKKEQRRKYIDDKKAPTSAYARFRNDVKRGEVAHVSRELSDPAILKHWNTKLSGEEKKLYKDEAEVVLSKLIEDERRSLCSAATITTSAFDKAANTVEVRCKLICRQHHKFTEATKLPSEGSPVLVFEADPVPDVNDESTVAAIAKLAKISKVHQDDGGLLYDVEYLPSASIVSSAAPDVVTDVSLIKYIHPGDSVRIQENIPAATHEVGNVTPFGLTLRQPWGRDACKGATVFKMDCSCRKEGFVEELVEADRLQRGEQDRNISESGFAAVNKLMKGDTTTIAPCSICLHEPVVGGTVVTQCCHIFCKTCALDLLKSNEVLGSTSKCPVCRKPVTAQKLVEFVAEEERAPEELSESRSTVAVAPADVAENEMDEDGLHTKPNAVQRPAATMTQLKAACFAPENNFSSLEERNPRLPALDELFLTHYRAATNVDAPKLARLRQDVLLALQADPSSKFVVFSHHKEALNNAKKMFERGLATNQDDPLSAAAAAPSAAASAAADTGNDALQCVQIMGGMSKEDRTDAVVQFMTNQAVKIILVSFGQGAAGLTLTAANHVFLLEPCKNAADEAQALTRAHRIGQKRAVRSVIYYTRSTVEERLLAARRANGDFDRDNCDNADNLATLSASSDVPQPSSRAGRGGGAVGGGANGEQLGLEGMAQDLGLDPAIFEQSSAANMEDDEDDEDFEEEEEMYDIDSEDEGDVPLDHDTDDDDDDIDD